MTSVIVEPGLKPRRVEPSAKSQRDIERQRLDAAFDRSNLKLSNIDWVVTTFLITQHVGCLVAPFFFSWTALGVCIFLHWLTCSIGICLGYHRYLAHKSMKLKAPAEFAVMVCGAISGEGSPLTWAATHRIHHQKSDQKGDPHSPLESVWWSHILWLFVARKKEDSDLMFRKYIPELLDNRMLMFFERTYPLWLWGTGLLLMGLGYAIDGWFGAISMVTWAMCVRMTVAYHSTWFVNSATHLWGYRNYETRDHSRNLWWVALVAYGEGWHNNHHAHPSVAPAGHHWWEIDMTWWSIKALKFVGQAYDVRGKIPNKATEIVG
jgi:fatty-acid desaturase